MKIINIQKFDDVKDPIKTEETISEQLQSLKDNIVTEKVYVSVPLAWNINKNGIMYTQALINNICETYKENKLFFVCQHILVKNLNFHNNLVFTPHATIHDPFIPIPHYTCNYNLKYVKKWEDREYDFSFIGSFKTHPVRDRLYDYFKNKKNCLIVDTGNWHFDNNTDKQSENSDHFMKVLGNTRYSLCPRGTGPSTIRIWESMAMGSFPIILSDILKMPLEMQLDNDLWLKVPENFDNISFDKKAYSNSEYFSFFSNENLYKSIVENL